MGDAPGGEVSSRYVHTGCACVETGCKHSQGQFNIIPSPSIAMYKINVGPIPINYKNKMHFTEGHPS